MKFLNHIDLNKAEIRNAALQNLAIAPSAPTNGQIYYDTATRQLLVYDTTNTAWALMATDTAKLNGQLPSYYLARTNHTGTQTSSTISDLATTVQGYRLDQFAVPTTSLSLNSQRIINVLDPSGAQDAATKNYVDTQMQQSAAGIDSKPSVRALAAANVALTGTQTVDGISLGVGDRILLTAQTTTTQNGVYVVASGAWSRAADADATGEITPGAFWFVEEGTTYGKTQWRCNNTGAITIGSTAITIVQFGAASTYTGSTGITLVGSDFRINLAGSSGLSTASGLAIDTTVVARKFSATIGDGTATSIAVTHNLGTKDVMLTVRDAATDAMVLVDWVSTSTNVATLTFAVAPAASAYRVTVIG